MTLPTDTIGPFDVRAEDLTEIAADQAVELFRQLLVIEALQSGIPIANIDVPAAITVADGGIDAEVVGVSDVALKAGLISEGLTRYQIKTGKFSASTLSDIRSLLVQPKFATGNHKRTKKELQPRVLSCFEQRGTFVVVLFGSDLVGTDDGHGETQISKFMAEIDPTFATVRVRILRANQLCSAIKVLAPGIAMRLNRVQGYDDNPFHDLSFMAESCDLEVDFYQTTPELESATEQITKSADSINGFQHIRVLGDAGAGKTHLIYRALNASLLNGCVLYCRDSEQAASSGPMMVLRRMASKTTIILVADECDLDTANELAALFKKLATKMLLITVDNVAEPASDHVNTQIIEVPQLEQPIVADIFSSYGIPDDSANWLASLCEGSPRAAHKLGQYIKNNPTQQPSQQLSHLDGLWERIVCSPHSIDSNDGYERLAVIRTLALFRQVAWETADGAAVQSSVLKVLQRLDPSFSQLKLLKSVNSLRKKRVLQGPRMLLITPKLLHVAMWKGWFDNYSLMVDVRELREQLSIRMQQHFDAMLVFVRESRAATQWADQLMNEGGIFDSLTGSNSASNASLFFAVAQAKPKVALRRLADALGNVNIEDRCKFNGDARRTAIHRLEQFAVPAETFFEAAQCLLLLAEAETESWSNNATGIFISLFGLGSGPVAASEVPPIEKIEFLRNLLHSELPFRRQIAVQALSKSLDPYMTRTSIDEVIGLSRLPDRWQPKDFEEIYKSYAAHLELLKEAIGFLPEAEAKDASQAILNHTRSLIRIIPLSQTILAFLRQSSKLPELREECIETVVSTLHYEGKSLSKTICLELQAILAEITESSFSSRLRRHAGMKLLEDHFDLEGTYVDAAAPELSQLAADSVANPLIIEPELSWLVTDEAKNGFQFGQLLGQVDQLTLWDPILSAWINAKERRSDFFIGGYLSSIYVKSVDSWEQLIEVLLAQPEAYKSVLAVIWRSGMSDRIIRKLLSMAKAGCIELQDFKIFMFGNAIIDFPLDVLKEVVVLLLERDDPNSYLVALDILDSRLFSQPFDIEALSTEIERVLESSVFVEGNPLFNSNHMLVYRWTKLANLLLDFSPEAGARLAVKSIANFANPHSITAGYQPESWKFLCNAARVKPDLVWAAIAEHLESPGKYNGTWHLLHWFRGDLLVRNNEQEGITTILEPFIFEWIDSAPLDRAWLIAGHCPPVICGPNDPATFGRKLLIRYGTIEKVRKRLQANNLTGVWSGSSSDHYRQKLADLEAHLEVETNDIIRIWLKEHREQLQWNIQQEVERELRESEY